VGGGWAAPGPGAIFNKDELQGPAPGSQRVGGLPVVQPFSYAPALVQTLENPAVACSMATREWTHCAAVHRYGVLSLLRLTPSTPALLTYPPTTTTPSPLPEAWVGVVGWGGGAVTGLDVWSPDPPGNSWWGQCWTWAPAPSPAGKCSQSNYI